MAPAGNAMVALLNVLTMMFTSVLVATSSKTWYGLVLLGMNDNDS